MNKEYASRREAISQQLENSICPLRIGIGKMKAGYPDVPDVISDLLNSSDRFPIGEQSPTGNTFFPYNFDEKHIEGDAHFGDENWQAIVLKGYPFPDSYKKNPKIVRAIESSLEIQNKILSSEDYKRNIKRVDSLPLIQDARNALEQSAALRYHLELSEEGLTLDAFTRGLIHGAPRRLKQIVYSIEEAKYKERITDEIGNPVSKIGNDIENRLYQGEEL